MKIDNVLVMQARNRSGVGLYDILSTMRTFPTSDPMLAAYYVYARGCAISIHGDREQWNRNYAFKRRQEDYDDETADD